MADWLILQTNNQRNWGFGLCFLYLRNVKGFSWNHKRVYRIYRELEMNLRIKPRHQLVQEKPLPLAVLAQINDTWSMDFMHDQLADCSNQASIKFMSAAFAGCFTPVGFIKYPCLPQSRL